jgi:hypothetical protein
MVPAQSLVDSDTGGCTPLRISSRKSHSAREISGCSQSQAEEGGRTGQQKQILVQRGFFQHRQHSVGPDFLVAQT